MTPLVSVIITCLNCHQFLVDAVNYTLAQTYTNIEIIIVDDGSTDDTHIIAESLIRKNDRIKYVVNKGHHGPASARNFGLQYTHGEWIQFYDVDDHLYPEKLKTQLDFLTDNNINTNQPMVLYSDFEVVWQNESGEHIKTITNIIGDHNRKELLDKIMSWHDGPTMPFHVNSTLFKRSIFDKKIFNADLMIFEEIELFTDLLHNNIPFIYIPTLAMAYRIHETNLTKDYRLSRLGYIQFLNEVYDKDPSLLEPTTKRINTIMERAIIEGDSEIFNKLLAIIKRAHLPISFTWKGKIHHHTGKIALLFWKHKISRRLRHIFS